jgi:hypothetical protein
VPCLQFADPNMKLRGAMRFVPVLIAAVAVAGAAAEGASAKPVPISDAELKVAYFGAPLITNRQAKAVPVGITRHGMPRTVGSRCSRGSRG